MVKFKHLRNKAVYNTYYECFEDFRKAILGFFAVLSAVTAESIVGQTLSRRVRVKFRPIQTPAVNFLVGIK